MNKPLPSEVEQRIAEATDRFRQELTELWEWVLDEESETPTTALEMERRIRDWIRQIGEDTQAQTLGQEERQTANGEVEIHARDIEYVVAATGEELAPAVYLRAVQRGVLAADEIGVLGDGANWIWNRIAAQFPKR